MKRYPARFEAAVSTLLGGQDMSEEFFRAHPELVPELRASAAYHEYKGGTAYKGAYIFFRQVLHPVLRSDFATAVKTPIPAKPSIDGRN
jgi:hypothetical protein